MQNGNVNQDSEGITLKATQPSDLPAAVRDKIKRLLSGQRFGVLATTDRAGHPYTNLVTFASSPDCSEIYFATPVETRKFDNLMHEPRVALLVTDCANELTDFSQAMAVTILGNARKVDDARLPAVVSIYQQKHPHIKHFARAADSAMFAVEVSQFAFVEQFQPIKQVQVENGKDGNGAS